MATLEERTGQAGALDRILSLASDGGRQVVVVRGPRASGISWLFRRAASMWEEAGGRALLGSGEPYTSDRSLFPWLTLAAPGATATARQEFLNKTAVAGGRSVPIIGPLTSHLVAELVNRRRRRIAREALVLSEEEQEILFAVQAASRKRRLLLSFDHLQHWDEASGGLLGLVLSGRADDYYPALADAVVLVADSHGASWFEEAVRPHISYEFHTRRLDRTDMSVAMDALGPVDALSPEQADGLYDVSGGRLDLLHDLALHLKLGDIEAMDDDLANSLMARRLREVGDERSLLERILGPAAFIGRSFASEDIQCLTGAEHHDIVRALRAARTHGILEREYDGSRFRGSVVHHYFLEKDEHQHLEYHRKFAECLRLLRPSEYLHRSKHALWGEDQEAALTQFALAVLASWRRRQPEPRDEAYRGLHDWALFAGFVKVMREAQAPLLDRRFAEALRVLGRVEDFLPGPLLAERDYARAQALLMSHQTEHFRRAADLLERWLALKDVEGELWSRIGQSLVVAWVEIGEDSAARDLERDLSEYYWARRKTDPLALHDLNALRRRSECLHQLPTATLRLEKAVAYFGPSNEGAMPRHPSQYYYALNNLVANLLASGRFEDAASRAMELDELVNRHARLPWPGLEIPASNLTLSNYVVGNITADEASEAMRLILDGMPPTGNRILAKNNLAVYEARSGQLAHAEQTLRSVYDEIRESERSDAYHEYFVLNNLVGVTTGTERGTSFAREWKTLGSTIEGFYPAARHVLMTRHALMESVVTASQLHSCEAFDTYLVDHYAAQVGPEWAFYGRGLLLTDIQFWTGD